MPTRREFLKTGSALTIALAAPHSAWTGESPAIHTSPKGKEGKIIGPEGYQFEVNHNWAKLPEKYTWQTTHNVAVDKDENLYVIHEGQEQQKDHPAIFVFDSEGQFVRAFGQQFQGGGHGIEVRTEGSEQFLYVCGYQQVKSFAKLTLTGETVWQKFAPMESEAYAEGEADNPQRVWGRDRFLPTNFAFLDDGEFLLADGYGAFLIHHYDSEGQWKRCFGGPGQGKGTFNTPHGIWVDRRGDDPQIVICDRAHHTLQVLDMDGNHRQTIDGFGLPANLDTWQDWMIVPELHARLTILDRDYQVLAQLGSDVERVTSDGSLRGKPDQWIDGKFVHPHDACFSGQGDIYVAEWVATGRVSKLRRLA